MGTKRKAKKQIKLEAELERQRSKQATRDQAKATRRRERAAKTREAQAQIDAYRTRREAMTPEERRNSNLRWAGLAAGAAALIAGAIVLGTLARPDDQSVTEPSGERITSSAEPRLRADDVETHLERNFVIATWYDNITDVRIQASSVWVDTNLVPGSAGDEAAASICAAVSSLIFSSANPDPSIDTIRVGAGSGERLVLRDGLADSC